MIKVNDTVIEVNHFPDNSLLLKLNPYWKDEPIHISWRYENDAELFTLICITRHLSHHTGNIILYLPYIPHARMDRVKQPTDVFTLKYFCEVINSLNFSNVIVMDPHSNVATALIDRVVCSNVDMPIDTAINQFNPNTLFFPDEGAMKRYADSFKSIPYAFGIKKRDWATGQILGLNINNVEYVKDKDILIIDDICSRGGTFYYAAKALKEAGAKRIGLYITHCENTILDGEIFKCGLIDNVYTTSSLVHCDELKEKITYVY